MTRQRALRQTGNRANCRRDGRLAHEGNRIDRDALATDVVAVCLADRPQRHLADLSTAADHDDPLAIDLGKRRHLFEALRDLQRLEVLQQRLAVGDQLNLQINPRATIGTRRNVGVANVRPVLPDHPGQLIQRARLVPDDDQHRHVVRGRVLGNGTPPGG